MSDKEIIFWILVVIIGGGILLISGIYHYHAEKDNPLGINKKVKEVESIEECNEYIDNLTL